MAKTRALGLLASLVVVIASAASVSMAEAATIVPDTTADQAGSDAKHCALREAISAADTDSAFGGCPAGRGADRIDLAGGTYRLTVAGIGEDANASGDLDVAPGGLRIENAGLEPPVIDGDGADRVLQVHEGASLTASGITVQGGSALGGSDPTPQSAGGGIHSTGTLVLRDSTVRDNVASYAAGIQNFGFAELENVTISGNRANVDSGGFDDYISGSSVLNNVTVTGNVSDADASGGGTMGGNGGGIGHYGTGTLTISNSIVAGNTDGSPGASGGAPDCYGELASAGYNLIGSSANCGFAIATGDLTGTDAGLDSLASNGGPTVTHALLDASVARDAGSPSGNGAGSCAATDQRGVPRPQDGRCDIGAYEHVECKGEAVGLVGTDAADRLTGGKAADAFLLLGGADLAKGRGGNDSICGGDGRDDLRGGSGRDRCSGGPGRDELRSC